MSIEISKPLGTAAYAATGDFDAAGAADAAQAAAIAASVSKTGDTMTGVLQFSGSGISGLRLNNLTATERDALASPSTGDVVFNTTDGIPCYYDGEVWRKFSSDGLALPVEFDFTAMDDGALPTVFTGATFAIVSGEATNTPSVGSELLTNPGLEGTYTAGLSPNLTKTGSPTVSESTGDVHGGSSAQQFTAAAFSNRLNWPVVAGIAGAWYKFSVWTKRTAGTGTDSRIELYQANALPVNVGSIPITGADWQQESVGIISTTTDNMFAYPVYERGSSGFDTIIADDGSLKRLTYADLFSMFDSGDRTATVKAQPSPLADGMYSGVVAWASAAASPDTYVMAWWRYRSPADRIAFGLMKCVSGTYTSLISEASAITVEGAWLEIRPVTDSTVALYYNNVQIGSTQTVSDCPGSYAGFVISGGNNLNRFFVG